MSSKDFLKTLEHIKELGKEFGGSGQSAGFVTKMKIELGFWVYPGANRDRMLYWKAIPFNASKEQTSAARKEIEDRIAREDQPDDFGKFGKLDLCVRFWASANVLGRDPMSFDQNEFMPFWKWEYDEKNGCETEASLLFKSIGENDLPLSQEFWGRYILEPRPWSKAQGDAGKTKTRTITKDDGTTESVSVWPVFSLPVEAFASEEAAKATVTVSGNSATTNNSQWSDKARGNLFPNGIDADTQNEIVGFYNQIVSGVPLNGRDKLPYEPGATQTLKQLAAKKELAELYMIETSDIDLMLLDEVF